MKKFQEIINGNTREADLGELPSGKNFKVCEYAMNIFSESIRQSLLKELIAGGDHDEIKKTFSLPLGQDARYLVSGYNSSVKVPLGLKNCTSVIVTGKNNTFATHNNVQRIIREDRGKFEQLISECFNRIQNTEDGDLDIFIAGGNYFSYEWLEEISDELLQNVEDKRIEYGFSEDQVHATIMQVRYALAVHNHQCVDSKNSYLESVDYLVEQIKRSFGDIDPLILGCNRVPASTDVIVKRDQIIVIKPLQALDLLNKPFKASEIVKITKEWDEAEDDLLKICQSH